MAEWDQRYAELRAAGLCEPDYGGPLRRHVDQGDRRLLKLRMDNSAASLRLWNFLLSEEDRLRRSVAEGKKLVGTMKDLGTVPVMAYSLSNLVAFYPDGAWWLPCLLEGGDGLLKIADSLGIDDSFCPVRAMLGAFVGGDRFPIPGLLTCSVGATCDDFSAIAQRLESLGFPILWWEMPHRRRPDPDEAAVELPGGFSAPAGQVAFVQSELDRVRQALEAYAGQPLGDRACSRPGSPGPTRCVTSWPNCEQLVFTASPCPLPALEMLIAEMLAIHFCSDHNETLGVLAELLDEVRRRVQAGAGVLAADAVRLFWVNPVADLRVMNLLEDAGGRVCGTDYMFCHALDPIPTNLPPLEALARMALADPMVGSAVDRAERICRGNTPFRRRGGGDLAHPRRQPLCDGRGGDRRSDSHADRRSGGGNRSAADHRCDGADPPHAVGSDWSKPCMNDGQTKTIATMICAGIDAGSRTTKVVLWDGDGGVVAAGVVDQGIEQDALAESLLDRLLRQNGIDRSRLGMVVATGYGRKLIRVADATITEITCQAWGVRQCLPETRTIIDIGGQDSKLLRLHADGTVGDFVMNDRCAAGTGRFLELLAARLGVRLAALGHLAHESRSPAVISNMCVVFAETEIIGLLASGVAPADIVAGVEASLATRVAAMTGRSVAPPIVLTGGVALVPGMEAALGRGIRTTAHRRAATADDLRLGAALLAWRRLNGQKTPA